MIDVRSNGAAPNRLFHNSCEVALYRLELTNPTFVRIMNFSKYFGVIVGIIVASSEFHTVSDDNKIDIQQKSSRSAKFSSSRCKGNRKDQCLLSDVYVQLSSRNQHRYREFEVPLQIDYYSPDRYESYFAALRE